MSSLVDVLKRFLIDHVSEFNKTDKAVLTSVLLKIKEKKFELALELFEAHLAFLKNYFEQSSEIMAKIREKIPDLPPVDPFAAAALAAFGKDDELEFGDSDDEVTANYKQHVVPESTVVATPRPKRQLSDQPKPAKKKRAVATNDGGKSSTKKPRKKSAYNMFTAGGGKRKDWQFADKLFYQDLADEVNNGKSVPTIIKPVSAKTVTKPMPIEEESKVETVAQESKKAEPSPEPTKTPPSVLELPGEDSSDANEPPHSVPELPGEDSSDDEAEPSPEPAETPPSVPEFPGEDSSDDDEYVEEEDRDRNNTPYLNVRDVIRVTLSKAAEKLVAQASAPHGQSKEFKAANKIAAFLSKTDVHTEEESKEDVHYTPEETNQFYVASEVDVDDEGDLEEIELGLHKDGTEDEYKFSHKMTVPVRFIEWEIISRADQTVEVTEGAEDDRWRAVLDCLHTYGGEGHPFGVPLVDADGAPLLDDRGQQRYDDIDNIAAIEGDEGDKGVATLLKEAATAARKVYTDALKPRGHTWKAKRGTDGFIGDVDLHEFVPPGELESLRQAWLNKVSLSNGPTNDSDVDRYVFDPAWKPPVGARTEEEKDSDADQIHIRTWALRVGMQQMQAIKYKMKDNQPKIEYDDDDKDKEHPIRAVAPGGAGRRILVQWGDVEYDAIVIANDPNADPPLLRCEYTRPSVQVGQWTMSKVRHGKDFRYVVEGPESVGEAKEGDVELGEPETFEGVQKFFAAHGIVNVPIISTDEGADWGPFDLNFEEDTFKKMELYDGKDPEAPKRKEDAAILAEDAAVSAAVKRLAVQEAHKGDVLEEDDPYLNNVVLFKGGEHDVEERKFEGGTYLYEIAGQWVLQDELAIKPPEEIEFEEDHGGGGNNAMEEDVYEEEDVDADTIYIYTDEEGKQYRVKIVGEPYQKMKDGKLDLDWYWDKRNEAERARLRADAIKVARAKNNEIIIGEYEIRRARLVIGGRKVEGGYTVFKDDSKVVTRHDMASLLHWLAENGLVIDDNEDIDAIGSLWDISEEYIDEYIEKYKDESGNVKQKHDFANSYSEFVDVVDDDGHRFPGVEQANLIRASEAEAEAAAAATAQAAEEAIVAQEDAKNADVVSSSNDSETDDSSDEEEDK